VRLLPPLPIADPVDGVSADRESFGDLSGGQTITEEPAYCRDIGSSKLGPSVRSTFGVETAPLAFHVVDIVALCSQEQVVRVNAEPVITGVAYTEVPGVFTLEEYPSDAVRKERFPAKPNDAVAATAAPTSLPDPTGIRLSHLREKTDLRCLNSELSVASPFHVEHYNSSAPFRQSMERKDG
jgi:hypothetical protein